jgi:hypothetical protein
MWGSVEHMTANAVNVIDILCSFSCFSLHVELWLSFQIIISTIYTNLNLNVHFHTSCAPMHACGHSVDTLRTILPTCMQYNVSHSTKDSSTLHTHDLGFNKPSSSSSDYAPESSETFHLERKKNRLISMVDLFIGNGRPPLGIFMYVTYIISKERRHYN